LPLAWGRIETMVSTTATDLDGLHGLYGQGHRLCTTPNPQLSLVLSLEREIDLFELEQLCDAVGWSRRPLRRVRKALQHSLLVVGLWRHDPRLPRLVGFARCTGDGVIEATVWDVAVHPLYQGAGLGKQLMGYVLDRLRAMQVERVSLFADPDVVAFYSAQGWELEPQNRRCAFWYSP
jgi:GNAT superfamily N-acetyltransferase